VGESRRALAQGQTQARFGVIDQFLAEVHEQRRFDVTDKTGDWRRPM
jgi:hypothetical protein